MSFYMLDENRNPVACTFGEFLVWHQSLPPDDRTPVGRYVDRDTIGNTLISTVFLNIDHGHSGTVPLVFETMVFPEDGSDEECERYATYEEALAGHQSMLAKWRIKLGVTA